MTYTLLTSWLQDCTVCFVRTGAALCDGCISKSFSVFLGNVSWLFASSPIPSWHSTKRSMWHSTAMPSEPGTPRRLKWLGLLRCGTGSLPWKRTPSWPVPLRLLASFLSSHLRTPVCPRLLIHTSHVPSLSYVINTIVNCRLKANLCDSRHRITAILWTTRKLPIRLNITPTINIK